jgi:hypothetical protein
MRPLLIYVLLFSVPAYGMQQCSPHTSIEVLPKTTDQQALESLLGIKITPEADKFALAKQIVPSMQRLIDNKAPQASPVARAVLLLQMLDRLLPGNKLSLDS